MNISIIILDYGMKIKVYEIWQEYKNKSTYDRKIELKNKIFWVSS